MKTITVNASKTYDITIGASILDDAGAIIREASGGQAAVVVTDDVVDALYGRRLADALEKNDYRVSKFVFPHGEESKNVDAFLSIINFLATERISRSDVLVALGGGVAGDLAGFAAACYMRGIRFIQIPTTLLAAVDSSVGGKTAVNLSSGKNLVGAFYQPDAVICDVSLLSTLTAKDFRNGCAEVIKYGVIADPVLLKSLDTPIYAQPDALANAQPDAPENAQLDMSVNARLDERVNKQSDARVNNQSDAHVYTHLDTLTTRNLDEPVFARSSVPVHGQSDALIHAHYERLEGIIARCVEIKRDIVAVDEFENGKRKLLNFGHTIGHAIELLSGYIISHGYAVAAGMAIITRAAVRMGLCESSCLRDILRLLRLYGLPEGTPFAADKLAYACLSDKKRDGDVLTMVFPIKTGKCSLEDIPISELEALIKLGLE